MVLYPVIRVLVHGYFGVNGMNKFRNIKHGSYDSRKEAKRGAELELLQREGHITCLQRQRVFELIPHQMDSKRVAERAVTYICDFSYLDNDGRLVCEDVKSPMTRKLPAYVIKRKLMLYMHGITVKEV